MVLGDDGQNLSKRLQNYPSPEEVFETYGADALRWFLVASPILRGLDLQIDREGHRIREVVRLVLKPLWNAYSFFCLYANSEKVEARLRNDSPHLLDRYILAKTRALVEALQEHMDAYDLPSACAEFTAFNDVLNNWYIRRSRDRFYKHGRELEPEAYDTLYTVLVTALVAVSPLLPLISEEIYRGLTGQRSVHLADWPDVSDWPAERELVAAMDRVREACSAALALRRANDVRVRQPLRRLTIAGPWVEMLRPFLELIQQELNVKEVLLEADVETYASFRLQVNARVVGKRVGKKM